MSNSIFTKISRPKVKRSTFNLSEEAKLSCNMGDLVPILCKEVIPGDHFKVDTELLIKFAPLAAPVMHRIKAYVHYFFVPMEQIWKDFPDFINPKVNVDGTIVPPWMFTSDFLNTNDVKQNIGTLADYFGLPILNDIWVKGQNPVNAGPFLAYQHIYNSYYRDENLQEIGVPPVNDPQGAPVDIEIIRDIDGQIEASKLPPRQTMAGITKLRKRAWAKDYFTSALPSPQAGDDVLIPVESKISSDGNMKMTHAHLGTTELNNIQLTRNNILVQTDGDSVGSGVQYLSGLKSVNASATINDLRKALALQRFKELAERGGTRYSEMVRNFFDTYLPDWYVDRPIFLGGSVQNINIGEVVQTSSNNMTTEQALGQRGGIASSYGKSKTASLKAPCHGYLIGILSIRPQATYQQGLERMWMRDSLYDYPFPQFANLGEQPIYRWELYAQDVDKGEAQIFGYTPRYAEWKEGHCHVCGEFRDSLSYWHFGRKFKTAPNLNGDFISMNDVSTDPFLVVDQQTEHIYINLYNRIIAKRPLPYFGTPSIL